MTDADQASRPSDPSQPPSGLTRRRLITGAAAVAGLVVGTGATEGANLLAQGSGSAAAKQPPTPGEALMTEHGLFTRLLVAYRTAADQFATGSTPPVGAIVDAAQVIQDYIHSFHEGLEEAYVFPRVRDQHADLIRTLLIQHDRGRHLTAAISTANTLDLTQPAPRESLRGQLTAFARMYEPHEAREDTVVYPALRDALSQPQLDLLAERFADLENQLYGDAALRQYLDRVSGVEQQLGIADLSVFTAPVPPT
jgi:hemerythrin-like domain-containing protein